MVDHRRAHTSPAVSLFCESSGCSCSEDAGVYILGGLWRSVCLGEREVWKNNNLLLWGPWWRCFQHTPASKLHLSYPPLGFEWSVCHFLACLYIISVCCTLFSADFYFKKQIIISLTTVSTSKDIIYTQQGHNGMYCWDYGLRFMGNLNEIIGLRWILLVSRSPSEEVIR